VVAYQETGDKGERSYSGILTHAEVMPDSSESEKMALIHGWEYRACRV
jgi:hypothetical protein